ncbi:MAG: sulfotransferase [Myxococcales bacterium]|nr:sulfotransferase [Myxococcales bacterium]
MSAPLFIIGTERSGSNLLRLILDAHSNIVVPHPPHVMRYFGPLEARYGDLAEPARFGALVDDVLALVAAHIHPWAWLPAAAAVVAAAPDRSLFGVYLALHELLRVHTGKARWGCKSTFMVDHVERIRRACPDARFLWLYRDARDVAASARESVFSAFAPAFSARLWADQQALALAAEPGGGMLRVPYESLVAEPDVQVRRICAFLGEEFEPAMLRWFEGEEATISASLSESWKHTATPMQMSRLARYRKDLTPEDLAAVEEIAGPMLVALGYTLDLPRRPPPTGLAAWTREGRWSLSDEWSRLRVEWRSVWKDKNVGRRWRREWLMTRIRWRLGLRGR